MSDISVERKIVVTIKGMTLELNMDDAKRLQAALGDAIGTQQPPHGIIMTPWYPQPFYPYQPFIYTVGEAKPEELQFTITTDGTTSLS